jgi:hypothetical protein
MANTNKTKAEILQELESIKGLLLEEDDIPILQDMEDQDEFLDEVFNDEPPVLINLHEPSAPRPGSAVDAPKFATDKIATQVDTGNRLRDVSPAIQEHRKTYSSIPTLDNHPAHHSDNRPLAKASGENPFLPQHIRERLHGNNPPPLFEYETAKKILNSTKNIANKTNKPRQYLVEEVMLTMMPQIERELRHRLFAMSVGDLEKLLNDDEE